MGILEDLMETAAGGVAATSAHSVAGVRLPLGFGKGKKSNKKKKSKKKTNGPVGNVYSFKFFSEDTDVDSNFDSADVISKLKDSAKKAKIEGEGTTAFALEDEEGRMIKVWVPDDQADDFQDSLEQALNGNDDDDDEENTETEIAEVLWNLRKDFDIVNVEWEDDIPEDQEETLPADVEEQPSPSEETAGDALGGEEGGDGGEGGEGEDAMTADNELGAEAGLGDEEGAKSALQSVIDMMKADAEARRAEAEAKAAEAKARESEAGIKMAQQKVDQEEKVLDMEAYYDKQKEEKGETERLAKLAKYQHDLAGEKGGGLSGGTEPEEALPTPPETQNDFVPNEDEEFSRVGHGGDTSISKSELGALLLKALRKG